MKRIGLTFLFLLSIGLVPAALLAQGKPEEKPKTENAKAETPEAVGVPDGVTGSVELIGGSKTGERESSKFEEYRDLPDGATGNGEIRYKKGSKNLKVTAENIGQMDQRYTIEGGSSGDFKVIAGYDEIIHRFAYDARTPFSGVGTGYLYLSPTVRNQTTVAPSTANETQANANRRLQDMGERMGQLMNGAAQYDLQLQRKTGTLQFDLTALDPVRLNVNWNHEDRVGTRPWSVSFGFGNAMEVPEPIQYTTDNAKVTAEYNSKHVYATIGWSGSRFTNHIGELRWDNPFRQVASTSGSAYSMPNVSGSGTAYRFNTDGPAYGLMDLYPNNLYQSGNAAVVFKELPLETKIDLNTTFGWMRQNDALVPMTTNTAMRPGAPTATTGAPILYDVSNPYMLERPNAAAGINTALYQAFVSSRPFESLKTQLKYRMYDYTNKTERIILPGQSNLDAAFVHTITENEITSYKKQLVSADADYKFWDDTHFMLGYSDEHMWREEREVASQKEEFYRGTLEKRFKDQASVGVTYEQSKRAGEYNPYVPFEDMLMQKDFQDGISRPATLPMLRKLDEAERRRERGTVYTNFQVGESFGVGLKAIGGRDIFPKSDYGLKRSEHRIYSGDVEWTPIERLGFTGNYTQERFETEQRDRQWNPSTSTRTATGVRTTVAAGDPYFLGMLPYDESDWTAESIDRAKTWSVGVRFDIIPKALRVSVEGSEIITDGRIRYTSPIDDLNRLNTATTEDTNNFLALEIPDANDTRWQKAHTKFEIFLDEMTTLTAGYVYERFRISDYNQYGFDYVPKTNTGLYNGIVLMGVQPKAYIANYAYVSMTHKF